MDNILKFCASFFVLIVVCFEGDKGLIATKKISIEISCKEIRWSGHSHKSCKVVHLTIESLNTSEFEIDNLTFARKSEIFFDSYSLIDTCFQDRFQPGWVQYRNGPYISRIISSYDNADRFVDNIACSQAQIHIYFSKFGLLEQTNCTFVPLGIEDDCRSREYRELKEVKAMVQKLENNDFQVVNKTFKIKVLQD